MKVSIYAVERKSVVFYVGQSLKPTPRRIYVLRRNGVTPSERREYTLRILAEVEPDKALETEARYIEEFWKAGQCQWNKRARAGSAGQRGPSNRVLTEEARAAMSAGGKRASKFDKAAAGRKGFSAMVRNAIAQLTSKQHNKGKE